jgi:hypothetical protein
MSEQEFDLYLKLLAKCLSLTPGQREQIADELRDHLEERLEELARAGVPREKAVVQALDEFGDAAVLAAHFTTIARLKRRRILMRLSLGSVGVLTAALLIGYAFWPENRAVRGPDRVVAQEQPKADAANGDKRHKPAARPRPHQPPAVVEPPAVDHPLSSDVVQRSKVEARIAEALKQPVDFTIEPQSFKDALDFIAARYQIPILLNQKSLDDANVDVTTEVKLSVPGLPLSDALHLLLAQFSSPLGYDLVHGVLTITTIDNINDHLETIVYDCRDLVNLQTLEPPVVADHHQNDAGNQNVFVATAGARAPAAAKNRRAEKTHDQAAHRLPLIQSILAATEPSDWEGDEAGTISELGGLLIIRQNPREHARIKQLLDAIRLMRKDGAFAALSDQYDSEAKKQAADQSSLAARVVQLEHALAALRTTEGSNAKPSSTAAK